MKKSQRLCYLFLIELLMLLFKPVAAQQTAVTLSWSPDTEAYLSHYVMYRDTIPGTMIYLRVIPKTDTSYVDMSVVLGKTYYYKLTALDSNSNESEPSNEVSVTVGVITSNDGDKNNMIGNFTLRQNYPNPFNPGTKIQFQLPEAADVLLKIYNVLGREVRTLVNENHEAGLHTVYWDGRNNTGNTVASGVYVYMIQANEFSDVKKMMLMK